jgi:heme oxygenase
LKSSARSRLRAATASAHAAVDRAFARFDLADRAAYAAFLRAHAAAVLPVEAWLDRYAALVVADWPARRRGQNLIADLSRLGESARPHLSAAPFESEASPAAVAGVLYVLEGSRLGGRVIVRGLSPRLPHTYLSPQGETPSWLALSARLDDIVTTVAQDEIATRAALKTFDRFAEAALSAAWESPARVEPRST